MPLTSAGFCIITMTALLSQQLRVEGFVDLDNLRKEKRQVFFRPAASGDQYFGRDLLVLFRQGQSCSKSTISLAFRARQEGEVLAGILTIQDRPLSSMVV
jgi:hypothetical protein